MNPNLIHNLDLDKVDVLLKEKTFEQLSDHERQFILEYLTEQEYGDMYVFYKNLAENTIPSELEPSSSVKTKLDRTLQIGNRKEEVPFFHRKISVFQVAAVAAMFFMIGFGINSIDRNPEKSDNIVDSIIYDTVQVIRYIQIPLNNHFTYCNTENGNTLKKKSFPPLNSNFYHRKDAVLFADNHLLHSPDIKR